MSVSIDKLSKIYGNQKAINEISFEVKSGEILGFLGPNGAGKSTTMKIATGYLSATSGTVKIGDFDVKEHPQIIKSKVGYLPEHNPLYLDMYIYEFLSFTGELYGIKGSQLKKRIDELVSLIGIEREKRKKIGELSKGYRQRIGLAQALIHDPEVLFLDEPTSGLDPNQILDIRELIKKLGEEKTVILSSHIMQEVEAMCSRAVIINLGEIVANDSVENLTKKSGDKILITFDKDINMKEVEDLHSVDSVKRIADAHYEIISINNQDARPELIAKAQKESWDILEIKKQKGNLEEIFHQLTQADYVGDL